MRTLTTKTVEEWLSVQIRDVIDREIGDIELRIDREFNDIELQAKQEKTQAIS